MISAFGEESNTFVQLAGYYITARLFMSLWAASVAYLVPMIRGMMFTQVVQYLVGTALWIGSTQVAYPASLGLIITALLIDIGGSAVHISLFRYARAHDSPRANRINRFFEFYPATNIEHKVERVNAFVCLVIGYGVVGVLYQNQGFGLNAFLGKAVLGLAQGYIFNWLYFEIDSGQIHVHAIRRHVMTGKATFIHSFIHSLVHSSHAVIPLGYYWSSYPFSKPKLTHIRRSSLFSIPMAIRPSHLHHVLHHLQRRPLKARSGR